MAEYPIIAGEVVPAALGERPVFPFISWAAANRFTYPAAALPILQRCGSAAEAFFARPFLSRPSTAVVDGGTAALGADSVMLKLQVRCAGFRIDAVVSDHRTRLAVEIDGMAFHHRSREQVAADYLRQRRIVVKGYTVIRFTAAEVFGAAEMCWRQVDAILAARGRA